MAYYSQHAQFYVGIDCIIFSLIDGKVCLLLTHRRFEPEKGKWSLMGGFLREGESTDEAARRVLFNLTGLDHVFMTQVRAFGEVGRDPGARVVSIAYCAMLAQGEYDQARLDEYEAQWLPIDRLPELGFDHPQMIAAALKLLRIKIMVRPYAMKLLPELFTLTQLQGVYEAILGEGIDKRNFRKRIAELECFVKTDQIDKTSSRRGAALYRFDEAAYRANKTAFHL